MLSVRLDYLNRRLGSSYRIEKSKILSCWFLVDSDDTIIHPGLTIKEMLVYLDGLITGIWMKEGRR